MNLHHDQDGNFTGIGLHPLYLPEQYLYFDPSNHLYGSVSGLKGGSIPLQECEVGDVQWIGLVCYTCFM